jgi:hypothetical protein
VSKIKVPVYLHERDYEKIVRIAKRLDRSISQVVEFAWRIAEPTLSKAAARNPGTDER